MRAPSCDTAAPYASTSFRMGVASPVATSYATNVVVVDSGGAGEANGSLVLVFRTAKAATTASIATTAATAKAAPRRRR